MLQEFWLSILSVVHRNRWLLCSERGQQRIVLRKRPVLPQWIMRFVYVQPALQYRQSLRKRLHVMLIRHFHLRENGQQVRGRVLRSYAVLLGQHADNRGPVQRQRHVRSRNTVNLLLRMQQQQLRDACSPRRLVYGILPMRIRRLRWSRHWDLPGKLRRRRGRHLLRGCRRVLYHWNSMHLREVHPYLR